MPLIEDILSSIGEPALAFAQQHWMFLLIAGAVGVMWLFGSLSGGSGAGITLWLGADADSDSDSADSGGGDGGGGD